MTRKTVSENVNDRMTIGGHHAQSTGAISPRAFSRLILGAFLSFIVALFTAVPGFGSQETGPAQCLERVSATSMVITQARSRYAKLCVTPDEMARHIFLTNSPYLTDSSIAVYRARGRKQSLAGDYWLTATEAEDEDLTKSPVRVRRYDAPLPESVAHALHKLWVTSIEQSRPNFGEALCGPLGIFSATTTKGVRLRAIAASLDQNSLCIALMNLSGSLIDYAKLPASQRMEAALKIEKESQRLLKRVTQTR
jgi:hypothetical protein